MFFSSVFLFLAFFTVNCLAGENDCNTFQTDKCGVLIWPFLIDTTKTPKDAAEMIETCNLMREGEKCTKDYLTKCANVIKKENAEDLLDSLAITIADFCDGALGKRFLPHGACLKQNLGKNFTCNTDAIALLEAAAISHPIDNRLKLSCCSYLKFDKCFKEASTNACNRRAARAIRNLVQSYAIFMVEKCVGFLAGPDRCDLTTLQGLNPVNGRKTITVFPALFDVIATTF